MATERFPRGDLFKVPFSKMSLREDDPNKREDFGDINVIVTSILANIESGLDGIVEPLKGYFKGGVFYVVRGHRRYEAMRIIYDKHSIDTIAPVLPEARGTTDEQRAIEEITSNNFRKEYTPLEQAAVVKDLIENHGYNGAKVATKLGVTEAWVSRLNLLNKAPDELREALRKGYINTNVAMDAVKQHRVEELLEQIAEGGSKEEEITSLNGNKITSPKASRSGDRSLNETVNSWKAFKAVAAFTDAKKLDPDKKKVFDLLVALMNNDMDEEQIKRYFYPEKDLEEFGE